MTRFFWIAQSANIITIVVALAALLIVLWLGPRRWTNISFALLLSSIILWMSASVVARLLVNVPAIGGDPQLWLNLLSLGFALVGITLFWFVNSLVPLPRRWLWIATAVAALVYSVSVIALIRNAIIHSPRRDLDGGLDFTITALGSALSAFHYLFDSLALIALLRRAAWRQHLALLIGVVIVFATSVLALVIPAVPIQTYLIAVGTLCMTYEVVRQQLFNPLIQLNQHLEAEVAQRTAALAQSLAEQERVRSELRIARDIQLSLLPRSTPQPAHLRLAGRSIPAQEVGGDFFAYHTFGDGRFGIAVGDVSGKGIPAALLMAFSLRTFELLAEAHDDQGRLLTACNTALAPRLLQSQMQTAFISVVLDQPRRVAYVANAGMVAPLLWRNGAIGYIDSAGLPLGSLDDLAYQQQQVLLLPGDTLLIVSDGIVEAMNEQREMWGFPRLEATLARYGPADPRLLVEAIFEQVNTFTSNAPPHDDITVVALQVY